MNIREKTSYNRNYLNEKTTSIKFLVPRFIFSNLITKFRGMGHTNSYRCLSTECGSPIF